MARRDAWMDGPWLENGTSIVQTIKGIEPAGKKEKKETAFSQKVSKREEEEEEVVGSSDAMAKYPTTTTSKSARVSTYQSISQQSITPEYLGMWCCKGVGEGNRAIIERTQRSDCIVSGLRWWLRRRIEGPSRPLQRLLLGIARGSGSLAIARLGIHGHGQRHCLTRLCVCLWLPVCQQNTGSKVGDIDKVLLRHAWGYKPRGSE